MLRIGHTGKQYIDEISGLMYAWVNNPSLKNIPFKAIVVIPELLPGNSSRISKAKDYSKNLERRMDLWNDGNLLELFWESETIQ